MCFLYLSGCTFDVCLVKFIPPCIKNLGFTIYVAPILSLYSFFIFLILYIVFKLSYFVCLYENDGVKLWTKLWGTVSDDRGYGITVDNNGYVYVVGITSGNLDGNINSGAIDIFLTKFNSSGEKVWTKLWGTVADDYGMKGSGLKSKKINY